MNSLYQQMMGNQSLPPNLAQIKQLMNVFRNAKNPQQMITNMANQNPQIKQVMDMVQNSGKSPKDLFYEMAKQKGVDPNQILNMLR